MGLLDNLKSDFDKQAEDEVDKMLDNHIPSVETSASETVEHLRTKLRMANRKNEALKKELIEARYLLQLIDEKGLYDNEICRKVRALIS